MSRGTMADPINVLIIAGSPRPVYLKADESLPYGFVVRVLAVLDQVGVEQVGMVTHPEGG